tara:strand:+ start:139 stop:312 length:174 start_codon:yes stop_codon:yes gene_type:complete
MHDIKKRNKYKNSNPKDYWKGYLKAKPNSGNCIFCNIRLAEQPKDIACQGCWKERLK